MRTELLPALSPRCATATDDRYQHESPRIPLYCAQQGNKRIRLLLLRPGDNSSSILAKETLMLSSTNFWMGFAGLIYLFAGVFLHRKEIAAPGSHRLINLSCIFIAVSLAIFAPEHFGGPEFVRNMVPSYMPAHFFWPYFVGCALLAAATSLTAMKCVRLSSTLLGLMFFLFVCMLYLPFALKHPGNRMGWTFVLRESSFCAGAWALAEYIVVPRRRNNRNG